MFGGSLRTAPQQCTGIVENRAALSHMVGTGPSPELFLVCLSRIQQTFLGRETPIQLIGRLPLWTQCSASVVLSSRMMDDGTRDVNEAEFF